MSRGDGGPATRPDGVSVTDWVFESLKREILENDLTPDEIVAESAVAERFDVSRGPAREALQRLVALGLVRPIQRVGYIITPVSLKDFDEVFQMRLVLEPLATDLATDRLRSGLVSDARLIELVEGLDEVVNAPPRVRSQRVAESNADFHREIAHLSGNARLEQTISELMDAMERVLHTLAFQRESLAQVEDDHPVLLKAMHDGDGSTAAEIMRDQLSKTWNVIREAAIRSGAPLRS